MRETPVQSGQVRKNFILDTNVLLHDPKAIHRFGDNTVVIPIYVIEEIDTFKKTLSELGRNARQVSRYLDTYRERGNLGVGVRMDNGGVLKVAMTTKSMPTEILSKHQADNLIMAVALDVQEREPNRPCIFVTKDTNLRIRADALGLTAENYEADGVSIESLYPGQAEIRVPASVVDALYDQGSLDVELAPHPLEPGAVVLGAPLGTLPEEEAPPSPALDQSSADEPHIAPAPPPTPPASYPNEYLLLRDESQENHTVLGRLVPSQNKVVGLRRVRDGVWGIRPRNKEQHFALDCLLNDDIKLVTLIGLAGTGKTLIALAAGLQKTAEEEVYGRLLVARPIFPLGRDIGYLPGDVSEKLNPWMQPIFDNVEYLMGLSQADKRSGRSHQELFDMGILQIEPLTYIRGRSIPNQYMIVDEAQNLTPHEVKTILTRVGDGTKLVLTGDPYQIDNPYVDSESNGLTYVVQKFKGQDIAATVTLHKGERSKLAELAANLL